MCKMFNAENKRLKNLEKTSYILEGKNRTKRETKPAKFNDNPVLNFDDAKRVESIVDKLYDDAEENGERVTYRQKNLQKYTTIKVAENVTTLTNTSRRFNFAPAELEISVSTTKLDPNIFNHTGPLITLPKWHKQWKHGIIPYFIDSKTYDSELADVIIKAFDYFEKTTCIRLQRLREKPTDTESLRNTRWLYISNPTGIRQCVHSNEHNDNRGVQLVVFGYDCMSSGDIVHEIMHVLGFSHEHTRPDRDQYITILWDNIKPGYKKYFVARTEDRLTSLAYDYASVLHYPSRAFSRNGQVTILSKPGITLGQRTGLSDTDTEKVSMVYGSECIERNKKYLLETCPSVIKTSTEIKANVTQKEIDDYFDDRLWPFGIVNYKLRDKAEFSIEERENLKAVIRHIEKETCLEFRDVGVGENYDDENKSTDNAKVSGNEDINKGEKENPAINKNETANTDHEETGSGTNKQFDPASDINNVQIEKESEKEESPDFKTDDKQANDKDAMTDNKAVSENEIINDNDKSVKINYSDVEKNKEMNATAKQDSAEIKYSRNPTKFKSSKSGHKRVRREISTVLSPSRRHASNILVLTRSPERGCLCPPSGRPNGNKELKINADCFNSVNDLLHLFVHVLGLDHQHNMYDRDSYIKILWENLTPEIREDFKKILPPAASAGFPYDYQSVMHYPWLQIKNGVSNIMYPIWNDGWAMGHWQGLSSKDVQKLNVLYFKECLERGKQAAEGKRL